MKRIITIAVAAAMLAGLCSCGCDKKEDEKSHIVDKLKVVSTTVPEMAASATEVPSETLAPVEDSSEVASVEAADVPTDETEEGFKNTEVDAGYTMYVGGNNEWGIILPPDTQIGDEAEDGSLFIVNSNIITAIITDKVTELTSVEDVKEYYSNLGEIKVDEFTVIRENGEYRGCFFEYLTEDNIRGFAKYVTDGTSTVCAAGTNGTTNAAEDTVMREVINSLVIFK